MTKRKREDVVEISKKVKENNVAGFTAKHFIKMIKNRFEAYSGLQMFYEASLLVKESGNDVVEEYLSESSDCESILCYLSFSTSEFNMIYVYKALTAILLRTAGDLSKQHSKTGIKLASIIIQKHSLALMKFFRVKTPNVITALLQLFTAIVMQESETALELLHVLNLKKTLFLSIQSDTGKNELNNMIRLELVRFAVSILLAKASVRTEALETGFLDFVFLQIHNDQSAFSIHLLLTTFLEKAIKVRMIKKSTKRHFLTREGVLTSIALLLRWDGNLDIANAKDQDKSFIHKLAYHFLFVCCCSSKWGIISALPYEESSRLENNFILTLLLDLNENVSSTFLAITLVAKIFRALPDLLKHYFNSTKLMFLPNLTTQWFNNCRFLNDIYLLQPEVPQILQYYSSQPNIFAVSHLSDIVSLILPEIIVPLERSTLNAIISHSEPNVQLQGLKIITLGLSKLEASINFMKNEIKQNIPKEMYDLLRNEVKKHIPISKTIMDVWKSICKRNKSDELEAEALKLLHLYQKIFCLSTSLYEVLDNSHNLARSFPTADKIFFDCFDAKAFDFYELFVGLIQVSYLESGSKSLLHLLNLLLDSPQSCNWFYLTKDGQTIFEILITYAVNIMQSSNQIELLDKVLQLLVVVFKTCKLVNHDDSKAEVEIWLHYLNIYEHEIEINSKKLHGVKDFFIKSALSSVKNSFNLLKLKQLVEEVKNDPIATSSVSWCKDLLETEVNVKENEKFLKQLSVCRISPLIVSTFQEISSIDSFGQSWNTAAIDRFFSNVLYDLFYCQAFSFNFGLFTAYVMNLIAKVSQTSLFPSLVGVCNKMSTYCVNINLMQSENSKTMKENSKCISFILDEAQAIPSVQQFSSKVFSSRLKICFTEVWIARVLYNLFGLASMSKISKKIKTIGQLFENVAKNLKEFFESYKILYEFNDKKEPELSEKKLSDPKIVAMSDLVPSIGLQDFKVLLEKLVQAPALKHLFLCCDYNAKIASSINDLITLILCKCSYISSKTMSFYKDKLVSCLINQFICEVELENYNMKEIAFLSFLKIHPLLEQSHLIELFIRVVNKVKTADDDKLNACICICLNGLTAKNFIHYPIAEVQKLFSIFLKSSLKNQLLLLSSFGCFLNKNFSLALCAHKELVVWCLEHFTEIKSKDFLQTLVTHNYELMKYFLQLCWTDKTYCFDRQSSSYKRTLAPVLLSIIQQQSFHNNKTEDVLLKIVISSYLKKIISKLSKRKLNETQVAILLWVIEKKSISLKKTKKIASHLLTIIKDDNLFHQSWKVASSLLILLKEYGEESENAFCINLISSLMSLSCQLIHENSSSIDVVAKSLGHLVQRLHQQTTCFIEENAEFDLWTNYIKLALKYKLENSSVLSVVLELVKVLATLSQSSIDLTHLYVMLTSHSKFFDLLLSEKASDTKLALLQLLYEILLHYDTRLLESRDYAYLFASYNATLSRCDQTVLKIIQFYEFKGVSPDGYKPFLWGKHAVKFYINQKQNSSENNQIYSAQVYDVINKQLMESTLKKFPVHRRLSTESQFNRKNEQDEVIDEDFFCYDPAFFLHFICNLLDSEDELEFSRFIQSGFLSFLFLSLSSNCKNIRNLSSHCLLLFEDRVKAGPNFRVRELLICLLDIVRRSMRKMEEEGGAIKRQFTVATLFLSHAAQLMVNTNHNMFVPVFEHLLQTNHFNMAMIPNFKRTFFSQTSNHETRRNWTLVLISDGLRGHSDYRHAESHHLFQLVMSYFSSSLCSNTSKQLILHIVKRACSFRYPAVDLVAKQALLPWLQGLVLDCRILSCASQDDATSTVLRMRDVSMVTQCLWGTLASFQDWMTEHVTFFRSRLLPQLLDLCFDIIDLLLTVTERFQSDDIVRESGHVFSCLAKVASEVVYTSEASTDVLKSVDKLWLSDRQSDLLRKASVFFKDKLKRSVINSFVAMLRWLPHAKRECAHELVSFNLMWLIKTWHYLADDVSPNQSYDALKWLHSWIEFVQPGFAPDLKSLLLVCYELVCRLRNDATAQSNDHLCLLRSIVKKMQKNNYNPDDDNDKLLRWLCKDVDEKSL